METEKNMIILITHLMSVGKANEKLKPKPKN